RCAQCCEENRRVVDRGIDPPAPQQQSTTSCKDNGNHTHRSSSVIRSTDVTPSRFLQTGRQCSSSLLLEQSGQASYSVSPPRCLAASSGGSTTMRPLAISTLGTNSAVNGTMIVVPPARGSNSRMSPAPKS